MHVRIIGVLSSWRKVADAARTTVNKLAGTGEPSSDWKRRMLLAEHSPVRKLRIEWKWYELKSWVSVHFIRHKLGIEHFVRTQRTDRTGLDRNFEPQGALIEHEADSDFQEIIFISRKRLCKQASPETREAWKEFLEKAKPLEPELYAACVPDCIYRGHCYEYPSSCGYFLTNEYREQLKNYRQGVNDARGQYD